MGINYFIKYIYFSLLFFLWRGAALIHKEKVFVMYEKYYMIPMVANYDAIVATRQTVECWQPAAGSACLSIRGAL